MKGGFGFSVILTVEEFENVVIKYIVVDICTNMPNFKNNKNIKGNFTSADLDDAVKDVLKHGLGPMRNSMMHQM